LSVAPDATVNALFGARTFAPPACSVPALTDHAAEGENVRTVDGKSAVVRHVANDRAARAAIAELQGAAVDRGAAGISVVGGEDQRSRTGLAQRAAARDRRVERKHIREVRGDQAIVDDERRYDRSGKAAGAEVERAAHADGRTTGRIDHAAVGDRERADRIATAR
jgi:hypothetical protein